MPGFGLGTFGLGPFGIGAGVGEPEEPPLVHDPALIGTPSSGTPVDLLAFVAFDRPRLSIPIMTGADSTFEADNSWEAGTDTSYEVAASAQAYAGEKVGVVQRNAAGSGNPSIYWWSPPGSVVANRWWMALIHTRPGWQGAQARTVQGTVTFMTAGGSSLGAVTGTVTQQLGRYMPLCLVGLAPAGVSRLVFRATVLGAPQGEQHRFDTATVDYLGTNISSRVKGSPSWRRGRSDELGPIQASTLTATLRNADGALTPDSLTAPAPYLGNIDSNRRFVLLRRVDGVLLPEWAGVTESWEQEVWAAGWSEVELQCVDDSKYFGGEVLPPLPAEIMLDKPGAYFRLNEPKDSKSVGSLAGDGSFAVVLTSKYGSGASELGADNALPVLDSGKTADDGQTWLSLNPSEARQFAGNVLDLSGVPAALPSNASGWTAEIWAQMPTGAISETRILFRTARFTGGQDLLSGFQLEMYTDGVIRLVMPNNPPVAAVGSYAFGRTFPIFIAYDPTVGTWGRVTLRIAESWQAVSTTLTGNPFSPGTPDRAYLGGYYETYKRQMKYAWRTPVAHAAFWPRVLTSSRTDAHAVVGQYGNFTGESEGNRIGGIASLVEWPSCWTRVDRGLSAMMSRSWAEGSALSLVQGIAAQTGAIVYFDAAGKLVMRNRHHRVNRDPAATFRAADGTPVAAKQFRPRKDDQYVENMITVKRPQSATVTLRDEPSIALHGKRAAGDLELAVSSEQEPVAHGQWRLATRATNRARVATLVLQPGARPALWPLLLTLEIGDRISVEGLPDLAPSTTMDCLVESISSSSAGSPRNVEVELGLSPWRADLHQMAELHEANEPFSDASLSMLGDPNCRLGLY
ncbi:hypothetical protein CcI49_17160 [Frankia sp. CcI49]|uniref:hypothetical protein n=1 Tax=Frankia sp. CcI49 TaxID=1745382 RepID=UPI000976ACF0|nr:hypothetical protein [Frankia sp. CcI49]ONH59670.1 hypothetical protein CcI49_17160 [Frankia sp. CcI49]